MKWYVRAVLLVAMLLSPWAYVRAQFGISSSAQSGVQPVSTPPTGACTAGDLPKFVRATGANQGKHYCCGGANTWVQCDPPASFTTVSDVTWSNAGSASFAHTYNIQTGTDPVFTFGNTLLTVNVPIDVADQTAASGKGNFIRILDNDTTLALPPTCANNGVAGTITILDVDMSVLDDWRICVDTADFFKIPNTGADVIANTEYGIGTGTGTMNYVPLSGDLTSTNAGVVTLTAAAKNLKVEELDGTPSLATTRTIRLPNGTWTTTGEAANTGRFEPTTSVPPMLAGLRYSSQNNFCTASPGSNTVSLNNQYVSGIRSERTHFVPVYFPNRFSFDEIGFNVAAPSVAGSTARVGLYTRNQTTGFPETLVYGSAGLVIDSAGAKTEVPSACPGTCPSVEAGWYFFAIKPLYASGTNGQFTAFGSSDCLNLGQLTAGETVNYVAFKSNDTAVAGPLSATATFTDLTTNLVKSGSGNPNPAFIWVKKAP